jgi:hypothetical protein
MEQIRDTHFAAGFAKLLADEIQSKVAFIEPFAGTSDDLHTLIAQRAYDLVFHAFETAEEHDLFADNFYGCFSLSTEAKVSEVPDLTEWSE